MLNMCDLFEDDTIRYDTIGEFNVDWKAEYSALSSTRSQKKKLKQPTLDYKEFVLGELTELWDSYY